ncbi:MAG: hypothetical protein ACYC61_05480 [Isosphaeraceae bacterium]
MITQDATQQEPGVSRWARLRNAAGAIAAWGAWTAMTIGILVYLAHYTRNIPYMDGFPMVPVLTGNQPLTAEWAGSQHNEHRPLVSRLIIVGLFRFVASDFRLPRFVNAGLLSAMAAVMILLARRMRGSYRATDAVFPMALLSIAQTESLFVGFAMNLVLSSALVVTLIAAAGRARPGGVIMPLFFGLSLVMLPLTGGSGLTLLPALGLWVAGYIATGWWSGRKPSLLMRGTGVLLLASGLAITALYFRGYCRPPYHPLPPSLGSVVSSTLMYLGLAVHPHLSSYRWPAGLIAAGLAIATLLLLGTRAVREPAERPRALGLMAIVIAMLGLAGAVALSRSGLGPTVVLAPRYVTLTAPLLCVIYISWLAYGGARGRVAVPLALLVLIGSAMSDGYRFSRSYGRSLLAAERRVEAGRARHASAAELARAASPDLYSMADYTDRFFRQMETARMGPFANPMATRTARAPAASGPIGR